MSTPSQAVDKTKEFKGNDVALLGIVLGVITFWLFAQTTLNIGPEMAADMGVSLELMNIAIATSAMFSGMFIVVAGGLADRIGRVKIATIGNIFGIIGSLMIAFSFAPIAGPLLLIGRALQGMCAAFIMPSTMALLKTYWEGKARQRAVSLWSMGSWGGSGLAAVFGGAMAATVLGWRSIFIICAIVSVLSILLMRQIPEDAPAAGEASRLDYPGIVTLALSVVSLLVIVTQGSSIGWSNWILWIIGAVFVVALTCFIHVERSAERPLVDFKLFNNAVFSGATLSNFLINATAGLIPVSLWVLQGAGGMDPATAGYITIGYAVFILAFIRVGEKLLQRFGSKKPMMWGTMIVILAVVLLMFTNVMQSTYVVLAIISYCLFGLGLAFYATPSTDAALGALPDNQAGAGSGVYKMASSLGAAFGTAIPTAIFAAFQTTGSDFVASTIEFTGRQDNLAVREAGMLGLGAILIMALIALSSIILFVPGDAGHKKSDKAQTKAAELLHTAEEDLAAAEKKKDEAEAEARDARERIADASKIVSAEASK